VAGAACIGRERVNKMMKTNCSESQPPNQATIILSFSPSELHFDLSLSRGKITMIAELHREMQQFGY
jgi:hypothetical protein